MATGTLTPTAMRDHGACKRCSEYVGEDELLGVYGPDGKKPLACPECFTDHYDLA